jgi:signal transduction histidine kinase/ActR/RegA family two-component response regulator
VLRVVKDREGSGYFVLTGSGMVYMSKNGKVRAIEGIPFYNNYDLFQNRDGKVFVVGGAGVFVFDYGELMDEKKVPDYTLMDAKAGLPGNLTSNAWNYLDSEGHLYLAGSSGVYSFDTKNYRVEVSAYRSEVKQIKYDGKKEITVGRKGIIIPRGVKEIELDLGVNNFTATDPMIRYYMSGVDAKKHVVYASKLEPIFYHELQFGNHEFHIEIVSAEGKVLAENEYTFWKERELYETFAFRLYFFLVLACMLFFFLFTILYCGVTLLMKRQRDEHEQVVAKLEREKADALEWALHSEEAANQSKSDFLATMSHEIRTPINAILGMNTMIMREAKQEEIKKYSKDIHNASKTLLTLINDILDFSKIESGRLELVQGVYCLGDVVEDLLNMVKPKAEDKNLTLKVEINPNIPNRLYGDDVRIEQAILNILNNAVKYTEKGSVTLWMDYDSFASGDILLKVRVSDTGIGIKEEDVAKLFSPYQRIDEQRNKKVEGTGLGMTITKNLLEKMGSTLEVSSVYGEGSTFSFAIIQPVRGEETLREYQEKGGKNQSDGIEREHFHAPDARILVVDDMKVNLMVVSGLLKRLELKIDTALSGKIAVQLAKEKAYDMILLDSMMPGMNGEETMRMIRRECPLNAKTPMVVLTAHAVKGAREGYLQMGYTDYLSKPIEAGAVEAMIQKYLPQEKIKS